MPLILRIDVDRPYGRSPWMRHLASRISSDAYLPAVRSWGYLRELVHMLRLLNDRQRVACVFFRQCTLPSPEVQALVRAGGHSFGLHLEDSRSYDTFLQEKRLLERHVGQEVLCVSKHGSGGRKYGRRHHAPYEPAKYVDWAFRSRMLRVLGNLEDPTIAPETVDGALTFHPSAFWLEPHWRDGKSFPVDWLIERVRSHDVVMLVHPENVLTDAALSSDFLRIVDSCETLTVS
jgi:hypothetical protein